MNPLADLEDLPRWVEAHGIAADPSSWRRDLSPEAFAVGNDRTKLVVIGEPAPLIPSAPLIAAAREMAAQYAGHALLVGSEALARALAQGGRAVQKAIIHTLPEPDALVAMEGAVLLADDAPLDHLRPEVREEILAARGHSTMWSVWVDGLPVAFAHAPWRSAAWFDISVDVDPSARQLGLGALVATAAIQAEREAGREPVWGADEDNVASRRLAHRLGFVDVDVLHVLAPVIA